MKLIVPEKCPVCGSAESLTFLHCKDSFAGGATFEIRQCSDCGFRFTSGFPDESEIGKYYEAAGYISHTDTNKGLVNKIYHIVRKYMLGRKGQMVESLVGGRKGRILDIGCGTGYFLNEMQRRGWKGVGVEKSPSASEQAKKNFNLEVYNDIKDVDKVCQYCGEGEPCGKSETIGLHGICSRNSLNDRFDVITLWHVLEHLQDLESAFDCFRNLLIKNGVLLIAVPNSDSFDARKYKEHWGAYDVPRHLWHFTPETLAKLAHREGFYIEKISAMPFDAFYVSMLSEKYKGNSMPVVRGALTGFSSLVRNANRPKMSSSIIYVLRRR